MMTTQSAEKPTVLVVDDTPDNLTLISGLLKDQYKIKVANSGQRALKIVESENPPDLVLLDIMMPEMDGYEVLGRIKSNENASDVPVIFLTAKIETNDKVKGFEAGAVDYISKPFQAEEVIARVNTHLTICRLHQELQKKHDELELELKSVGDVQRSLLPNELPTNAGMDMAAYYRPSRYAGGDYYDVIELPENRLGILIADVSGHGTRAAVLMAMTYALFHDYPGVPDDPVRVLNHVNEGLRPVCNQNFVTALYAVYDPGTHHIRYFSAGHMPPLVYRPSQNAFQDLPQASSFPLGIAPWDLEDNAEYALAEGDVFVFYTDGITERMNERNELYGEQRLCEEVAETAQLSPTQIVQQIARANDQFSDGRPADDDCTLLVGVVK
jgi:serine phosphatase RsbU (regulator of sigma subunit)